MTLGSNSDLPPAPLANQNVLVTRPRHQCQALSGLLETRGARVLVQPTIKIIPLPPATSDAAPSQTQLQEQLELLVSTDCYSRVVFVSSNGVNFFFDQLASLHRQDAARPLNGKPQLDWVAIGQSTANQLARRLELWLPAVPVISTPPQANSASLAEWLIQTPTQAGTLIVRANRGSDVLAKALQERNLDFQEVVAYLSIDVETLEPEVYQALDRGDIDWITITSSAIAKAACRLLRPWAKDLSAIRWASISPTTSEALRAEGIEPDVEAASYDMTGLVEAMEKFKP